ncbi:hypothetical protein V1478_008493 [Vespula squamosa]|uniref:Uncharacterized protein n=1 Tax=Vespula squamosa TaxID=30214 RepID=A0ABD2AWC3_VESSQ
MITLLSFLRQTYINSQFLSSLKIELQFMEILSKRYKYISTLVPRDLRIFTKESRKSVPAEKKTSSYLFDWERTSSNLDPICINWNPIEQVERTRWQIFSRWKPNLKFNQEFIDNIVEKLNLEKNIVYCKTSRSFVLENSFRSKIQEKRFFCGKNSERESWRECIKFTKKSLFLWTFSNRSYSSTLMIGHYPWKKGLVCSTIRFYSTHDDSSNKPTKIEPKTESTTSSTKDMNSDSFDGSCRSKIDWKSLKSKDYENPSKDNLETSQDKSITCKTEITKESCEETALQSEAKLCPKEDCPPEVCSQCPVDPCCSKQEFSPCPPHKLIPPCPPKKDSKKLKLYRIISIISSIIILIASAIIIPRVREEVKKPRPEFEDVPYMYRRTKRFPWGDGNHSLFHNPVRNPIPPDGYEVEDPYAVK